MKRERHPAGTTSDIQERRRLEQARYDYAMRQLIASREPGFLVLPCVVFLLWLTWGMPTATPVLMAATVASTLGTAMLAANYATLRRLARRKVYIETPEGNDPTGAADALDVLIDALKAPRRDGKALRNAYVQAVDALQGLRPQRPLSQLVREGYYPSRPRRSVEDREEPEIVNYDVKPYEWHWDRAMEAADALRGLLRGEDVFTEEELDEALAMQVPPLRTVLERHGVQTWRIAYMPNHRPLDGSMPHQECVVANPPTEIEEDLAVHQLAHRDVLTSVEPRFNASATMHAASLRSLATAFGNADAGLFLGDDRTTGEVVLERDLPRLVAAFIVADDAATGEERDGVRVDFARSLAVMRDTMDGIMARHVIAARSVLADQTRFIEQRHGASALDG